MELEHVKTCGKAWFLVSQSAQLRQVIAMRAFTTNSSETAGLICSLRPLSWTMRTTKRNGGRFVPARTDSELSVTFTSLQDGQNLRTKSAGLRLDEASRRSVSCNMNLITCWARTLMGSCEHLCEDQPEWDHQSCHIRTREIAVLAN